MHRAYLDRLQDKARRFAPWRIVPLLAPQEAFAGRLDVHPYLGELVSGRNGLFLSTARSSTVQHSADQRASTN